MTPWFIRSDRLFTADPAQPVLLDGYLEIDGETIAGVWPKDDVAIPADARVHDYTGHLVTPGLIDPHTHLVHAGSRHHELGAKLSGLGYLDLHEKSGILYTVQRTREATYEALYERAKATLARMLSYGVTTVEAKSGYGLDKKTELTCLAVAKELDLHQPIDIESTFMGAHAIPPEFAGDADGYLDFLLDDVLPEVKAKRLARFVDIFCEDTIFSVEQSRRYLQAAKAMGFLLKMHADEIVPLGGAELAAEVGCVSAEHLMAISDQGIADLAAADVVACLLPATTYFLMSSRYAPMQRMLDCGVKVAVATDYNPGSSPTENLPFALGLAVFNMKIAPVDALLGVTRHAAAALARDDIGQLKAGCLADIHVSFAEDPDQYFYRPGSNQTKRVYKRGRLAYKGQAVPVI
ncbi:MAG TPA: imidazolonepropionase [Clostridiaceae bacterium]|jgi:imidazolonepropionase|nr:imidazolonepropionase [Clostridiaceae bacterium]